MPSPNLVKILAASTALWFASTALAQPANDDCAGAVVVNLGTSGPFDNSLATTSLPTWPCASGGNDLWFSYTPTAAGTAIVTTCGVATTFDTGMEVFSGGCGALVSIQCNDDACGLQSAVSWPVTANTTYHVRVGGFNGATGMFVVNVCHSAGPASNDDCTTAVVITPGVITGIDTSVATTSSAWPCANGGSDVWYQYTPLVTGSAVVRTCSPCSIYDTCLEVLDGTAGCGALVSVTCNDDSCGLQSSITWPAVSGTPYYIRLGGFGGATGITDLILTQDTGFNLVAAAETTPLSGPLLPAGGSIRDNDILRFNFADPNNLYTGNLAVNTLNLGTGVQAPAVTAGIPGFVISNSGSSPAGFAYIMPIQTIGGADFLLPIPPGVLQAVGDSIHMQGLVLDLAASPLPVTATGNDLHFYRSDCPFQEEFENLEPQAIGIYPFGWSDGGGIRQWTPNTGGTPSGGTGPTTTSAAPTGEGYFYCEASTPALNGDDYRLDSPVWDATLATNDELKFQLNLFGTGTGTLDVFVSVDGGPYPGTPNYTYPNAITPVEWEAITVDLSGLGATTSYQFRFVYTHAGSFSGDCCIDSVGIN